YTSAGLQSSVAFGGAFSANAVIARTDAFIVGSNIAVDNLAIEATRQGFVGSITGSFAGATRSAGPATAVAGSVAVNIVLADTDAYIKNSHIALVGDSHVKADDS